MQREDFYLFEEVDNSHLAVSKEGQIYLCSQHYGDVSFSNQQQYKSDHIDLNKNQEWVYLISYSKDGEINWIKNNRNISHVHTITCSNNGIYIAQSSVANQSFDLVTDTTESKYVCLSFINNNGKEEWVTNFPISEINSINLDQNNNLIIQAYYNANQRFSRVLKYSGVIKYYVNDSISLNKKNDFLLIKMNLEGNITNIYTERIWLENCLHCMRPSFTLSDSNFAYLSYETYKYFSKKELENHGLKMASQNAFGHLCKLLKINFESIKFD